MNLTAKDITRFCYYANKKQILYWCCIWSLLPNPLIQF